MAPKRISVAWKFFDVVEDDNKLARCKLCERIYSTGGGTSNLLDHLKRSHNRELEESADNYVRQQLENTAHPSNRAEKVKLDKLLIQFMSKVMQPLNMVEDAGFIDLVKDLNRRHSLPCRNTVSHDASDTRQNVDFQQQSKKQQKQQQQQFSDVPDTETDPVEASDSDGFVQDDTCDTRQSVDLQQQREQQQQFADVTDNEADRVDTGNSDGFVHDIGATYIPSANAEQQCYLKWKFHQNNQQAMLSKLLKKESFCDVTIACEEKIIRAHKLMLSASSSYFEMILSRYEDQNPIIILKDVRYDDMSALLQFIYKGEVNIEESQLSSLLETADMLKVKGLSEICRETRRVETPLQAVDIKTEEEEDDASSTFEPAKTMQETKRTRTTSIPEESFQRPVEGMSNICGEARRLEDPMQAMDIKIEDEEDASATFESAKTVQQRRRTVPVPEESFHIPMKIPRRSSDTEITQNEPTPVSQSSLSSNPSSSAGSSVHIEGIIRLPEFLMGHGSYHDFWKKPWVVRALKAVSDREMTLRNCSDLLGVGYDVLYSRYRRVHGCLKEGSVDSPGPSQDNAFRFLRTVGDQEGNIIVSKDQPPPTTAALPAVSHSERPADTSEIEDTLEPIVNVKMEPSISLSDQFESEIMKDNVDVHNMDKCVEITNFFFCADNP
ncbi:uncharacterized protein [Periplaneta americana]|uniref:uncharacterized protein isoform X4 n=1 Tax=Periplaneta americana TaxID=6978 RepID=UPI0037E803F7